MRFRGKYDFLSNFYPCEIIGWGIEFPTAEHVYVAAKTFDMNLRREIAKITTPGGAKRFGRNIELRPDWEEVKVPIMTTLIYRKFALQHPALGTRLAKIEEEIIEHNHWHDNFWGVCGCGKCPPGKNILGLLLAALRSALKETGGVYQ